MASLNGRVRGTMRTANNCGHVAYRMDDKTALAVMAVTSFYGEEKFYGDNTQKLMELAEKLCYEGNPEQLREIHFRREEKNYELWNCVLLPGLGSFF